MVKSCLVVSQVVGHQIVDEQAGKVARERRLRKPTDQLVQVIQGLRGLVDRSADIALGQLPCGRLNVFHLLLQLCGGSLQAGTYDQSVEQLRRILQRFKNLEQLLQQNLRGGFRSIIRIGHRSWALVLQPFKIQGKTKRNAGRDGLGWHSGYSV